jgi:dTDP-4-amino-4,6-dideoxygalactose transaminase
MIPFNVPFVPEISKQYVLEALESRHQQGDGPFTARASKLLSDLVGGGHVLLTPSCTHALEMASILANIGPGDEVILPSYTFTSAATAVTKFGAIPVFVDIEMETKGIDVNQVREAITSKTKAISWVNYGGVAPDIEGLQGLAKEFDLLLIEDNAHGLGGTYKGKPLGSFGDFATQSFHATKNIQCGEGGALIINNPKYIERAEIIREKGTDRSKYIRGEVQKYQWVDLGSSYLLAESLSAILLGQLETFAKIQSHRKLAIEYYLSSLHNNTNCETPRVVSDSHHLFYVTVAEGSRDLIISKMKSLGAHLTSHYEPLHSSVFSEKKGFNKVNFYNSTSFSLGILRFPVWSFMTTEDLRLIVETFKQKLQDLEIK